MESLPDEAWIGMAGSGWISRAGVGSQVPGGDAVDGAGFVVVGQGPADPDRTDDGVVVVAEQEQLVGDGHKVAVGERRPGS